MLSIQKDLTTQTGRAYTDPMQTQCCSPYSLLGRQDSEYDNSLAEYAEAVPALPQKEISLPLLALLIVVPGGLFVLAALALRRHLKG